MKMLPNNKGLKFVNIFLISMKGQTCIDMLTNLCNVFINNEEVVIIFVKNGHLTLRQLRAIISEKPTDTNS